MIDLATYRSRIGTFIPTTSRMKGNSQVGGYSASALFLLAIFLATATTALALETDPSIEKNPGPSQQTFKETITKKEKVYTQKIECLNHKIAKIASHRYFLQRCMELDITPTGYEHNQSVATASSTTELVEKHKALKEAYIKDRIQNDIIHYDCELPGKVIERDNLYLQLETNSDKVRFECLKNYLNQHYETSILELQKSKKKKINKFLQQQHQQRSSDLWIPPLNLKLSEKQFLLNNERLCDQLINAAMTLIMQKLPHFIIQSTTFHHQLLNYCGTETVHVHHNGHNHYVTSSSIGKRIQIYDSLNSTSTPELEKQMTALYSPDNTRPQTFQVQMTQQQVGATDCGIFAIAYAVELAHGHDPSAIVYDQSEMRNHLLKCFEKMEISPFPRYSYTEAGTSRDITNHLDATDKWSSQAKRSAKKIITNVTSPIPTSNKFTPLSSPSLDDACEISILVDEEYNFNETLSSTPDKNTSSTNNSSSPNLASHVEANSQQSTSGLSHDTPESSSAVAEVLTRICEDVTYNLQDVPGTTTTSTDQISCTIINPEPVITRQEPSIDFISIDTSQETARKVTRSKADGLEVLFLESGSNTNNATMSSTQDNPKSPSNNNTSRKRYTPKRTFGLPAGKLQQRIQSKKSSVLNLCKTSSYLKMRFQFLNWACPFAPQ